MKLLNKIKHTIEDLTTIKGWKIKFKIILPSKYNDTHESFLYKEGNTHNPHKEE